MFFENTNLYPEHLKNEIILAKGYSTHMTFYKPAYFAFATLFLIILVAFSGCSVILAARQPTKKNLSVLQNNVSRDRVLAELGQPISSEMFGGERVEIYQFKQGYQEPTKAARALFHGAADVFTLGIWEAVGTPAELLLNGQEIAVRVVYDNEDHVKAVRVLKGKVPGLSSNQPQVTMAPESNKSADSVVERSAPKTFQFAPRKNPGTADVRITPASEILPNKTVQVQKQDIVTLPVQSEILSKPTPAEKIVETQLKTFQKVPNQDTSSVPVKPLAPITQNAEK
ncbi:MAG: hypothetical protein HZA14_11935 [Nitrospirae bacterium]|nr:hypothetical protein [Nitrospirota bacterium]